MRHPAVEALDQFRLLHDWTWIRLAAEMDKAGFTIAPRTLHYLCKSIRNESVPRDRTVFKVQQFLEYAKTAFPPPDPRHLSSSAA